MLLKAIKRWNFIVGVNLLVWEIKFFFITIINFILLIKNINLERREVKATFSEQINKYKKITINFRDNSTILKLFSN